MAPTDAQASFRKIRDKVRQSRSIRREVEYALVHLLDRINPTERSARFVVGTYVEWLIAALGYAAGVISLPQGHNENDTDVKDLLKQQKGLFSVKSSFTKHKRRFKLKNTDGRANWQWVEPTIFISPFIGGIAFVDPRRHSSLGSMVKRVDGGYEIDHDAVLQHAQSNPEDFIELDVPFNSGDASYDMATAFAREMLGDPSAYPLLSKMFTAYEQLKVERPTTARVFAMLGQMAESGEISDEGMQRVLRELAKE